MDNLLLVVYRKEWPGVWRGASNLRNMDMKRLVLGVIAILGSAGLAAAQNAALDFNATDGTTHRFTAARQGIQLLSSVNGDTVAVPVPSANPSSQPASPQPEPRFYYG